MCIYNKSKNYVNKDLLHYYNNNLETTPYSFNKEIGYRYEYFYFNLYLRYLTKSFEGNIMLPINVLFLNGRYNYLRRIIFEEYYCNKITIVPGNISYSKFGITSVIFNLERKNIDSFKILEFIKIKTSNLYKFIDYDIYLTLIKNLKKEFEKTNLIKFCKLEKTININEINKKTININDIRKSNYKITI